MYKGILCASQYLVKAPRLRPVKDKSQILESSPISLFVGADPLVVYALFHALDKGYRM